ncbi:hypothetical protein VHEMI04435 [[Torrubiella] hemipterigena]|uniref:deuterolysin n=1 Tax=[Torrubiella] hemipterigena TaxID=1531966 RepID=A0A0A1SV85_9HYPO|nr:hypothetical protein VHEMI04435 [[Torrubiella] hemipterigena]
MQSLLQLLAFSALAAAVPTSQPALDVAVERVGNSGIKATFRNPGASELKLLKTGTILGDSPTKKVHVTSGNSPIAFKGMHITVSDTDLPETAFVTLPAGGALDVNIDIAEIHDLGAGGDYAVRVAGSIPYTTDNGRTLNRVGAKYDAGKILSLAVNGEEALQVHKSAVFQRAEVIPCTEGQLSSLETAQTNCNDIAAAAPGGLTKSRMDTWFHAHDADTIATVKGVYNSLPAGCNSKLQCSPGTYKTCADGAVAYQNNGIYLCPVYFNKPVSSSTACHNTQTQGNVLLHETTHMEANTVDSAYGYEACIALSTADALNNADTYARMGQDIYAGCS